jgi:hypothetical protein
MLGWTLLSLRIFFSVLQEMHLKLQGPPARSSRQKSDPASTDPAVGTPPPRLLFFGVPIGGQMNGSIWKLKWEPFWDTQLLHLVCVSVYNARMFGMLGLGWQSLYLCFFNAVSIYFGNLSCCLLVWDMVLNLTQSHPVPRLPRPFRVLHFCFPERAHFLHLAGWPLMASRHRKAVLLGISTADDKQPEKTISIHQR